MKNLVLIGLLASLASCSCIQSEKKEGDEKKQPQVLKVLEMKQKANSKN